MSPDMAPQVGIEPTQHLPSGVVVLQTRTATADADIAACVVQFVDDAERRNVFLDFVGNEDFDDGTGLRVGNLHPLDAVRIPTIRFSVFAADDVVVVVAVSPAVLNRFLKRSYSSVATLDGERTVLEHNAREIVERTHDPSLSIVVDGPVAIQPLTDP